MKKHKDPIGNIFHYFLYYKLIETILSIIVFIIAYKLFPTPFNFFINLINQYIKF